uniref:RNA-directed DNA polymerase, eukaryota, reverse transcriptase zinc-binding domain protein n=1 Tax=Tanacetum cinerariifolium TaxID=118510 RepID=A0A699I9I3_TANCI|nr:hypothetical protein [Tanacetum cinerariifolium]
MGIGVNKEEVDSTAAIVGCSTFSTLVKYLGVQVGANMSRLSSWHEVEVKISSRLSRWKLKTLSIREAIRRNLFNGMERSEQKIAWISWDKILESKKYGGLGVSSFYALNRALLFKWVWHFFSQGSSLWPRFIKAIHGVKGVIDNHVSANRNSIWLNIFRDIYSLKQKGIDLLSFVRKKVGDEESSLFWDDTWLGEATLKMQYPRLYTLELYKDISVVDKMRHPNLYHSFRRQPRGGAEQDQFRDLSSRITDIIIPQIKDRLVWSSDGSSEFSVKSVQNFIDDSILPKCDA